jgi:hypothetical protein
LLPSIFILVLSFTEEFVLFRQYFYTNEQITFFALSIFGILFSISIYLKNSTVKIPLNPDSEKVFSQTKNIANYLKNGNISKKRIVLLSNFASSENLIPNYSDTYRALIQENFSVPKLLIEGDEFVSFKGDVWQAVFWKNYLLFDEIYLILQENPEGVFSNHLVQKEGRKIYIHFIMQMKQYPNCFEEIVKPIQLSKIGERKIIRIQKNDLCELSLIKY